MQMMLRKTEHHYIFYLQKKNAWINQKSKGS